MRRIVRLNLSERSLRFLKEKRADEVARRRTPKTQFQRAKALWALQNNKTFKEVRRRLAKMCSGLNRCMYCEDSEGVDIDHFWPMSRYPLKAYDWTNYLYSCARCNRKKSNHFPLDEHGKPILIDPTADAPAEHLLFSPRTGKLISLTRRGRESKTVYGLRRKVLTKGRFNTWVALEHLIASYARVRQAGDEKEAKKLEGAIRGTQFSSVFAHMLSFAEGSRANRLRSECLAALNAYPEIKTWL